MSEMREEDDACTCPPDDYPLEPYDFVGIALGFVSAVLSNAGAMVGMMGNEFYASARYRRAQKAKAQARAEMSRDLREWVDGS